MAAKDQKTRKYLQVKINFKLLMNVKIMLADNGKENFPRKSQE